MVSETNLMRLDQMASESRGTENVRWGGQVQADGAVEGVLAHRRADEGSQKPWGQRRPDSALSDALSIRGDRKSAMRCRFAP
jgi:hypothetical protein